jgi:hypothetical protein
MCIMQTWPLFGPKLFDAFMALGTFETAECLDPATSAADKARVPGAFAMGCNCGDLPLEDSGKKLLLSYTVPAGEGSKCRDVKAAIEDFMVSSTRLLENCSPASAPLKTAYRDLGTAGASLQSRHLHDCTRRWCSW